MEKVRRKEYSGAVPLRLRGFLHALRLVEMTYQLGLVKMTYQLGLVEMTTKKSTVISTEVLSFRA